MNKLRKSLKIFVALWGLCSVMTSCVSVESYQKMYLNDVDMECVDSDLELFEYSFQAYREGAAGANGGSVGGGCGCN